MKKFLLSLVLLTLAPLGASAAVPTPATTRFDLDNSATAGPRTLLGTQLIYGNLHSIKCIYDYAVLGGGTTATPLVLKDVDGGPCELPAGAIVHSGYLNVLTSPRATVYTSSTLAWSTGSGASDLLAGQAMTAYGSTGAGSQGSSLITLIPVGTTTTMIRLPAKVNPTLTVNGILTSGKINVFINYLLSN